VAGGLVAGTAGAQTLDDVKAKGFLQCGVSTGLAGFAYTDADGKWHGFDVDHCRAVAAAIFGDPEAVKFTPTTGKTRFTALASGEIDMLARNTTWTLTRDADLGFDFLGINYYDGQGFMVKKSLGVTSAEQLDGATVCIQTGTTTELNLADYFRAQEMNYEPLPIETNAEAQQNYLAGACDVYTTDKSGLAATRSTFENPADHVILPETISKEPLGPLVREGDEPWGDLVYWVTRGLVAAEEYGITAENVEEIAANPPNPSVARLLGAEGNMGEILGVENDYMVQALMSVGNYGELFEKYLTPVGLDRGLNALYTEGGLQYAPPFR
jgi:general L-amino acid transport system substrate-binding protein